jgi:mono/diheme cytochrome c family protein
MRNISLTRRLPKTLLCFLPIVFCVFAVPAPGSAAPFLSGSQRSIPNVAQGELLFGELNCIACHGADEAVQTRLMSNPSPRLENAGNRLTPQFLRSFLTRPQREKPGTTMPDVLGHLTTNEKSETVDALVHRWLRHLQRPV